MHIVSRCAHGEEVCFFVSSFIRLFIHSANVLNILKMFLVAEETGPIQRQFSKIGNIMTDIDIVNMCSRFYLLIDERTRQILELDRESRGQKYL